MPGQILAERSADGHALKVTISVPDAPGLHPVQYQSSISSASSKVINFSYDKTTSDMKVIFENGDVSVCRLDTKTKSYRLASKVNVPEELLEFKLQSLGRVSISNASTKLETTAAGGVR
jgi:hypothetical protein